MAVLLLPHSCPLMHLHNAAHRILTSFRPYYHANGFGVHLGAAVPKILQTNILRSLMYYVGCLPQSLTPCSNHYQVLPSVVHDMCNVIPHVIKSPPLNYCAIPC